MLCKQKVYIEPDRCKGCGICSAFCPGHALAIENGKVTLAHPEKCVFCGSCEMRCPDYAIYLDNEEE